MPSTNTQKPAESGPIERELERERQQHAMNQDAKAHLGDEDSRHKDARETPFSSAVRRYK